MIRTLMHHGADLKHKNHRGETIFSLTAASLGNWPEPDPKRGAQTLQWLTAHGLNIQERDRFGWTLLNHALQNGDAVRAAQRERQGFRVGLMDALLLHDAACVDAMLDRGENPNQTNPEGGPLLMWAVKDGNSKLVAVLLKHGADVHRKDRMGKALLWRTERDDIAAMLERAGAD